MRSASLLCFSAILFFSPLLGAETTDTTDCRPTAIDGGIACIDGDEQVRWEIHHPSIWPSEEAYHAGEDSARPVGPVDLDGTHFYAVRRDLIEVDRATGAVADRVRFPDTIRQILAADDHLEVAVGPAAPDDTTRPDLRRIEFVPGQPLAPEQALSIADLTTPPPTALDARWLATGTDNPDRAIELLEGAQKSDPTNPFLPQLLGALLQQRGDDGEAARAFSQAADSPEALWRDLLHISSLLDDSDAPEDAERALRLGLEQLEALGIDDDELNTFLPMAAAALGSTEEVSRILTAVQDGDFGEAYRLGMGMAENLPAMGELSDLWAEIIDENKRAAYEVSEEAAIDLDRQILIFLSALFSLALLLLVTGLRSGATGRLRPAAFVVPLLLFAVTLTVPYQVSPHVEVAHTFSDFPVDELAKGPTSPKARQQLLALGDDPAVRQFVSAFLAERRALQEGEEAPQRIPVVRMIADSAYADAQARKWAPLRSGEIPDPRVIAAMAQNDPGDWPEPRSVSLLSVILGLLAALMVWLVGNGIGRVGKPLVRPLLSAIPGGAERLAPLSGLVLVALVTSICALAGLDSLLQRLALPEAAATLGLEDIEPRQAPSRTWAWITLIASLAVHGLVVKTHLAGDDPRPRDDGQ